MCGQPWRLGVDQPRRHLLPKGVGLALGLGKAGAHKVLEPDAQFGDAGGNLFFTRIGTLALLGGGVISRVISRVVNGRRAVGGRVVVWLRGRGGRCVAVALAFSAAIKPALHPRWGAFCAGKAVSSL